MTKTLILSLFLVFCAEASQDQPTLTAKNAQSKKIETAFNINIVCSTDKKSEECFSYRESLYKKLGCQLRKDTCELMDQERAFSQEAPLLCRYKSENCVESKDKGLCEPGFNSRWLDGINSMAICVKADAATKKGRKDAIK